MNKVMSRVVIAHKTLTVWYGYFVAGVITLQASWDQFDDYIPKKWQKIVMGIITLVVVLDKLRRSKPSDSPAGN